jgi:hypothetical protein
MVRRFLARLVTGHILALPFWYLSAATSALNGKRFRRAW